jgi:hypothetical protein
VTQAGHPKTDSLFKHYRLMRKCKLRDAGVGNSAGDAAEGWRAEGAVGLREGWGVGDVEEFGAEFDVRSFGKRGSFSPMPESPLEGGVEIPALREIENLN